MSVLRHIGTYCACTHAYIPLPTMLQDNVMQLWQVTGFPA